jgi:hypothetical protein
MSANKTSVPEHIRNKDKTLDERMVEAGMIPLSEILTCKLPVDKWRVHTGVKDIESFKWWVEMRLKEFMTMRINQDLDDTEDEMYEWILAQSNCYHEVLTNLIAAMERSNHDG